MATQDLLDIAKTTLAAQNLREDSPGALVYPHQAMKEPGPGIEHLLQGSCPCEIWHDFGIDGRLV
jgi:hypothetical protein